MALHTDFRPKTLDDIYGNKIVIKAIKKLLSNKDRPHSYLLTGPRGCGKTTIARILAKEFGCNVDVDFIEINTASFRGIDTAREVIKKVNYPPMGGKARVWFFDECHQITKDAQEALLKVVEQPPEHTYFIFSTTDPQDLKPTLKDRCASFDLKPLSSKDCFRLVRDTLNKLDKKLDTETIKQICDTAEGRPRTTLVLLEKVLSVDTEDEIQQILQSSDEFIEMNVSKLVNALMKKASWKQITTILKALNKQDPEQIRRAVVGYLGAILMNSDNKRVFSMMLNFSEPYYNNGKAGLVMSCYACFLEQ